MKTIRLVAIMVLCMGLLFSTTSCLMLVEKDNGKHHGWYKNSNNPHHPNSTNPGKFHGKTKRNK